MEKMETIKEAQNDKYSACDEKWTKRWEEILQCTNENVNKEVANMDHDDFSSFLQEIEHH